MPLGANKAAIMGVAGVSVAADVVLLSSQTADNDTELSFAGFMTSTYGAYIFKFYNIDPGTDRGNFLVQFNADGASGYNESLVTTCFRSYHAQEGGETALAYLTTEDQVGTGFNHLVGDIGFTGNENAAGEMRIFNPSSTTYTTHWYSQVQCKAGGYYIHNAWNGGYINATAAITDVQFKMHTGNMYGTIKMWGVL